jgi:uncharacterized surface protein with fasciclin (FAS1) repeats
MMNKRHQLKLGIIGLVTAAVAGTTATAAPANAADAARSAPEHRSLVKVLMADRGYDHDWSDFDILEKAVGAVLAAKPDSAVSVLADGRTRLTAFLPTDRAFRRLVTALTGFRSRTERATFRTLSQAADVDTLETVLLYHVVPGKTLGSRKVARLGGATVTTAAGVPVSVRVRPHRIALVDQDPDARDPRVIAVDINRGSRQVAHAIDRVLRPIDL